jgi:hypothetical protein
MAGVADVVAEPIPASEVSVFINCPFDEEYEPLLNAIVLSVLCCGFVPRIATETGTVAEPRIQRICGALHDSRYSIHDLSRCQGEGDENLARFNMPLELGIAMGRRYATEADEGTHDWLVLIPENHAYAPYVSDLAGFDPEIHAGSPETIVPAVMGWLLTRDAAMPGIEPSQVLEALPQFEAARARLKEKWMGKTPPWYRVIAEARSVIAQI